MPDELSDEEKELLEAKKNTEEKKTEVLGAVQKLLLLALGALGVGGVGFGVGNMGDNVSQGETTKEAVIEVLEERGPSKEVEELKEKMKDMGKTVNHVHDEQQKCTHGLVEVKTKLHNVDKSIEKVDTRQQEQTQLLHQIKGSLDAGGLRWFPPTSPAPGPTVPPGTGQ